MRFPKVSRRWLIAGGITFGTLVLILLALGVIYPRVGAYMIRQRLSGRLAAKLGREVVVGDIDVSLGHATIRDVNIRGKLDGDTPLVHIERIDVDFDATASLVGKIELGDATIRDIMITLRRDQFGHDNVRDIIDRLHAPGDKGKGTSQRPKKLTVTGIRML